MGLYFCNEEGRHIPCVIAIAKQIENQRRLEVVKQQLGLGGWRQPEASLSSQRMYEKAIWESTTLPPNHGIRVRNI